MPRPVSRMTRRKDAYASAAVIATSHHGAWFSACSSIAASITIVVPSHQTVDEIDDAAPTCTASSSSSSGNATHAGLRKREASCCGEFIVME